MVAGVAAAEFAADGEAGAVDSAIDDHVEVAVVVVDEDIGQVLQADQDAAALVAAVPSSSRETPAAAAGSRDP